MIYTLFTLDENNKVEDTISFDVVKSFGEEYSSNISQNVVENGFNVSDSINLSNPKFSITGIITDSKFRVKGHLITFDGFNFTKQTSQNNRDVLQQVDDDEGYLIVKEKLISLWQNKQLFGILESSDLSNISTSQIRSIFPCVLANLSFSKDDNSEAVYPQLSIEKITYSIVETSAVSNPTPALIPKYQDEALKASSSAGGASGSATGKVSDTTTAIDGDGLKELKDQVKAGEGVMKSNGLVNIVNSNISGKVDEVLRQTANINAVTETYINKGK